MFYCGRNLTSSTAVCELWLARTRCRQGWGRSWETVTACQQGQEWVILSACGCRSNVLRPGIFAFCMTLSEEVVFDYFDCAPAQCPYAWPKLVMCPSSLAVASPIRTIHQSCDISPTTHELPTLSVRGHWLIVNERQGSLRVSCPTLSLIFTAPLLREPR